MTLGELNLRVSKLSELAGGFIPSVQSRLRIKSWDIIAEAEEHPELYHEAGQVLSKALELMELTKMYQKCNRAAREMRIRGADPSQYNMDKLTESSVNALLEKDEKVLQAERVRIKVFRLLGDIRAVYDAFEHRRSMMNNIQDLLSTGNYAASEKATDIAFREAQGKDKPVGKFLASVDKLKRRRKVK